MRSSRANVKWFSFVIVLIFFSGNLFCQSYKDHWAITADSLVQKLEEVEESDTKLRSQVLLEIGNYKKVIGEIKLSIKYARKAKDMAKKSGEWLLASRAYALLIDGYTGLHYLDSADLFGKENLFFADSLMDSTPDMSYEFVHIKLSALKWWAHSDWQHYKIDAAYEKTDQALALIRSLNLNEATRSFSAFRYGHIYELRGMMREWDLDMFEAMHFAEEYRTEAKLNQDSRQLNTSNYWYGWIKFQQEEYDEALEILLNVRMDWLDNESLVRPWHILRTIGRIYGKMGRYDSLKNYAQQAITEALLSEDLCQAGNTYYRNMDDAIEYGDWKWAFANSYGVSLFEFYVDRRDQSRLEAQMESEKSQMVLDHQIVVVKNRNRLVTTLAVAILIFALFLIGQLKLSKKSRRLELMAKEKLEAEKGLELHKRDRLNSLLDYKKRQLTTITLSSERMNSLISEFSNQLTDLKVGLNCKEKIRSVNEMIRKIRTTNQSQNSWGQFYKHFESVHPNFFRKLLEINDDLTQNELRHAAYMLMNLSNKEVANMYGISHESVKKARWRLKIRLNLAAEDSLQDFINRTANSNALVNNIKFQ